MQYGNTEVYLSPKGRENLIRFYLGKTVTVKIDRPIGFVHHTKGITLHYTVNYGYLPGVIGGDGEEQDVYVLGVEEPLETFTGRVIAAVRRRDDNEDKLVAAPEGMVFHQGQIAEAIEFVEQYFDSRIDPIYHRSCGVIPFRKNGENVEILLLHQRDSGFWSVPKGHMEAHETEEDTARRELKEEIGLTAQLLPGFRHVMHYRVSEVAEKDVVLFLGAVEGAPEMQEEEITRYRWATLNEAEEILGDIYRDVLTQVRTYFENGR